MDEREYRLIDAVSQSRLALMAKSPSHYRYAEIEPTEAMAMGTILHQARFSPDEFRKLLLIEPSEIPLGPGQSLVEVNKRKPAHRAWLEEWRIKHEGRIILTDKQFDAQMGMLTSIAYNPECRRLFKQGESEVVGFGEYNGHKTKGRADWIGVDERGLRYGVDLKKTQEADPDKFSWTVLRRHYDLQAWWYTRLFALDYFVFVAVEEKAFAHGRHGIGVYRASGTILESGERKALRWTNRLTECLEKDSWPSYTSGTEDLFLPEYALKKMNEEQE